MVTGLSVCPLVPPVILAGCKVVNLIGLLRYGLETRQGKLGACAARERPKQAAVKRNTVRLESAESQVPILFHGSRGENARPVIGFAILRLATAIEDIHRNHIRTSAVHYSP